MSANLILLGVSLMIWGVGEGMFFIFQPLYLQQLGANPVTIGTILGAAGIAMAITHIPAGHLADKIGRRPLLLLAWIIGTFATWVMALAPSLPIYVIGVMIFNITAFVMSPMNSYITAARGNMSVGRAITIISAFYNTGAILGPLLGGLIGQQLGLRAIYVFAASLFILSTVVLFPIKSQPIETHDSIHINNTVITRRFITYQLTIFLAGFSMYLAQPLSSNYLQNQQALSLNSIGILGSISSIGIVILNLGLGSLNAHTGFLLGQLSVCLFNFILCRATSFPWFCLAYFLIGGYRASRALAAAQTRNLVHPSRMGVAYGITETIGASAIILAAPVAGFLYSSQPTLMYLVGFFLIIISIIFSARFIPHPENSS